MHFEFLVEDQSGEKALNILIPKIIGSNNTFKIKSYKGIGHLPKGFKNTKDLKGRHLLNSLPPLLRGYGRTFNQYGVDYNAAVIVVCDLDSRDLSLFIDQLNLVLDECIIKPETRFCIAIEEFEAWLLGDIEAIKLAYPNAKESVLKKYENDSICGTWETLADIIYAGGSSKLTKDSWVNIGSAKCEWATKISEKMVIGRNSSPSFKNFVSQLNLLVSQKTKLPDTRGKCT